jgi:hypothetical protein
MTALTGSGLKPGPDGTVRGTVGGFVGWLKLSGLAVVEIDGEWYLQATAGGGAAQWVQRIEVVANQQASWVLLEPVIQDSLTVTRNGQVLSPGIDFNRAGQTITFLGAHVPQTGDVLRIHHQTP